MTATFGSLFAGVGGFDLAFERAGFTPAFQVEIDKKANDILARHWPGVTRFTDIKEVTSHVAPEVEVLVGGFPCQDISVAGRRAGLEGERSGLWWEYHRLLDELRPGWCVIENVAGLLSSGKPRGSDLGAILGALGDLGYGFAYRVLDAQGFGVPQRRRRVFIVGRLGDGRGPVEVLLEPESGGGDPGTLHKGNPRTTVLGVALRGRGDGGVAELGSDVATTLRASQGGGDKQHIVSFVENQRGEVWEVPYTNALAGNGGKAGQGYQAVRIGQSLIRRLTPVEYERLQGFPDDHTAGQADTSRYKQMGNAVAVPVVQWIAERMMAVIARELEVAC